MWFRPRSWTWFRGSNRSDGDDGGMGETIVLGSKAADDAGYRQNLPLERDLSAPIAVDARAVRSCHPMFAVRLRLFIDWHRAAGHSVTVKAPTDAATAQLLADFGVGYELADDLLALSEPLADRKTRLLPIRRLNKYTDVEEVANEAVELLQQQAASLAHWGNATHMAIGELCDNALLHGRNELGAYIAADRITEPQPQLRLAIADLGIGIPEHIRSQHPEWQDDTAAITRAIERGVSGTGDPSRGNGFSEVFNEALETDLVRAQSAAHIEIRSSKGQVGVTIAGGTKTAAGAPARNPRRGTWITYTITTV
jgi:hypothetical protein